MAYMETEWAVGQERRIGRIETVQGAKIAHMTIHSTTERQFMPLMLLNQYFVVGCGSCGFARLIIPRSAAQWYWFRIHNPRRYSTENPLLR